MRYMYVSVFRSSQFKNLVILSLDPALPNIFLTYETYQLNKTKKCEIYHKQNNSVCNSNSPAI